MKKIMVMVILLGMAGMLRADPVTRVWIGPGNADVPGNWAGEELPVNGDHIRFDGTSGNCTWNLNVALGGWTQTVAYAGTVTMGTRYSGNPADFTNLVINGDVTLEGGTWTHAAVTAAVTNRIAASIGGSFTLGANAGIDADGKVPMGANQPGSGNNAGIGDSENSAGSHGGHGGYNASAPAGYRPTPTYGSFTSPFMPGSGAGDRSAGGAIMLAIQGAAVVNGTITASGGGTANTRSSPSGGSIYFKAASLSGSGAGKFLARGLGGHGGGANVGGGGGRIAVILESADDFENFELNAAGGTTPRRIQTRRRRHGIFAELRFANVINRQQNRARVAGEHVYNNPIEL